MAKKTTNINELQSKNQWEHQAISKIKGTTGEIAGKRSTELKGAITRHAWPRQVIEHVKYKLYPIESGVIKFFNPTKGKWFISPDNWSTPLYVQDFERTFKDGEPVKYIEIDNEALVTAKGVVKFKSVTGDTKSLFITPDDGGKDVSLILNPTYPHNKVEGSGNIADKSRPEYAIDLKDFNDRDEVEFIANKTGIIVAIQKK